IAQWLLLRQQVSWANWWVLASAVGGALGGAVGLGTYGALTVFGSEALGGVVGGIVGLGVFGLTQWLVLRRQVSWANWWVLASVVSLALAALLTGVVFWAVGDKGGGEVGNGVVYGAIYGAITGGALVWLLRWPVPDAEADEAKV
ncbi:hypothetical protein KFU94_52640, partial [Chloroflexi bacterium TSY]|nr:hypothetical protein [Chloroflexi bacterium TSY]